MIKYIILALISSLLASKNHAQNLDQHRWKERVLLIVTDSVNAINLTTQDEELYSDITGLKERKLIVYRLFPDHFKKGLKVAKYDDINLSLYKKYSSPSDQFQIILIGLDGAIKFKSNRVLVNEELFSIIDGMPMRSAELNKNK